MEDSVKDPSLSPKDTEKGVKVITFTIIIIDLPCNHMELKIAVIYPLQITQRSIILLWKSII